MSVDYPRSWEITRASNMDDHHDECSWRVAGMLCDCDVLMKHPETLDTRYMFVKGGEILGAGT
jgi:hypothetical protein